MADINLYNQIIELDEQIEKLKDKRKETIEAYLKTAEFQPGDKVEVDYRREKITCFINEVVFRSYYSNDKEKGIEYKFSKMKKDGTKAEVSAGIYSYNSIKKVD